MEIVGGKLLAWGFEIDLFWVWIGVLVLCYYLGCLGAEAKEKKDRSKWNEEREKQIANMVERYRNILETAAGEALQSSPWMAEQFSDFLYMFDQEVSRYLAQKSHPAIKASKEVSSISKEKKALQKYSKLLQYQISFYENAFPWLEDFKELDSKSAWSYAKGVETEEQSEYNQLKAWLSPEEYQNLPNAEKYQIALDRYLKRKKTNWEIGIDFERYIGFELESRGYKVKYQGALMGLEDMGRDLIAVGNGVTLVIQCKRWAQEKIIHEKHIFQLYGSVVLLAMEAPNKKHKGVFVTTTILSDVAKKCADYLGIEYIERCEVLEYPMIKCNVGKSGEKIYHLPFDQQYDRVEISTKKDSLYVATVEEAESRGFRRAYRWKGNAQ